jgi:RNA polymerase sigma-70 factor (ECF subfamily)
MALEYLCGKYWYPLYTYLRRQAHTPHEAEDLVQTFFARLLERETISVADPSRGRFRSFVLTALRNFVANERDKTLAQKRGGGIRALSIDAAYGESRYAFEPGHHLTPERLFEKQWAVTLLDHVMAQLREEHVRAGRELQFDSLKSHLTGTGSESNYAILSEKLGISKSAAMTAVSRLRRRYRELLRSEIASTVASPEEVDDEIRRLFESLGD